MRKNEFFGLNCQCSSKESSLDAVLEESQGRAIAFLFPLWRLPFRETVFGRKVVFVILPDA
ncbi:hypothetical protein [Blautia wexlerae]|uniref:hypothetical protein n=1 Tax=Blautia wexlerae TaxID=418240 RepID=UPI00156DEE62|nr:hypothetical protein [Blautia wexlerae]NSF34391.1 hypothetical protein [Blautia wexlerae]NSF55101.1 hypothetical protein [Blautia wexlerae]